MTKEQALALRPGDRVRARSWAGDETSIVGRVDAATFPDDPVVFFADTAGFWRSSRLQLVPAEGRS